MTSNIEDKIRKLPEELQAKVLEYINRLSEEYSKKKELRREFSFDWEGGLSELKNKYTSVELQHKALEWR